MRSERHEEQKRQWKRDHPDAVKVHNRRAQEKRKKDVIDHYGGKCQCCGEDYIEFLSIDHKNGGGTKHRREVGSGYRFYAWVKRNNYPKDLQCLCFNCNMATAHGRKCPHERE